MVGQRMTAAPRRSRAEAISSDWPLGLVIKIVLSRRGLSRADILFRLLRYRDRARELRSAESELTNAKNRLLQGSRRSSQSTHLLARSIARRQPFRSLSRSVAVI